MITEIGRWSLNKVAGFGSAGLFLTRAISCLGWPIRHWRSLIEQLHAIGVLTVLIIVVSGLFVGMVLALQGYNTLVDFGAESSLGLVVALSLTRELGPVLTGLLFAGRAGSALTAEIGLMKTTEQLAAMEMMAVDPMQRVISPRLLAGLISMPILAAMFTAVGVLGGHLVGVGLLGIDSGVYWSSMQGGIDFTDDILNGVIKSLVFGLVVIWIALLQGYQATPTSEGVSRATTRTVVNASLAVLALDFILTSLMFSEV